MRLERVATGHSFTQKLKLAAIRLLGRREPPDVVKTLFYRPELWGRHQSDLSQVVMRGPSGWSVGERELFAAFVSRLHQCLY